MNDQKKRKLGQGMKPRGTNETGAEPEDEVSADAGQQDPENDTIQEVEEDAVGGGRLEPETTEKEAETQTVEKVANEVEKGADLAPTEAETQPSGLEEMLRLSVTNDPIVIGLTQGFTPDSTVAEVFGGPVTISAPKSLQNLESPEVDRVDVYRELPGEPRTYVKIKDAEPFPISPDYRNLGGVEITRFMSYEDAAQVLKNISTLELPEGYAMGIDTAIGDDRSVAQVFIPLGQQPNGTFKLAVAVPEGYIEGIKLQAQLDNMTTEEWVSFRLGEYLESWFYGK